ncbi:MAG: lipid A phosphoethanolamine transferase [Desulfovibrionaceae bacterium]|nr:lipid A phosphoethanolamine transferase [Desulfovibrionaceae bacterium]
MLSLFRNKQTLFAVFKSGSENYLRHLAYSIIVALAYTVIYNIPYYSIIYESVPHSAYAVKSGVIIAFFQILPLIYVLSFNRKIYLFVFIFIIFTSSILLYYTYKIGVVHNLQLFFMVYETNIHEIKSVVSFNLVLLSAISAMLAIAVCRINPKAHILYKKSLVTIVIMSTLIPLASGLLRNDQVRKIRDNALAGAHHAMPYGYMQAFVRATRQHVRMQLYVYERDVYAGPAEIKAHVRPLYIVLALGESARADHLPVYGYARGTMPKLSKEDLHIFPPAFSMATGTTDCVLGILTQATVAAPTLSWSGPTLLSVFKKAGFRTVWLTNQGSVGTGETRLKAVSESADYYELSGNLYKPSAKLADTDVLPMLDRALAGPERDTLIVLHTYGSHFNYDDRYHDEHRIFTPVCGDDFLECPPDRLINSYDNSLVGTDAYLGELIRRLRDKNAVLFMTSDHGQSLDRRRGHVPGEQAMARPEIRMVPFMLWFSPTFENREKIAVMESNLDKQVSHDMFFHSMLDAAGIRAPILDEELNIFSPLLRPHQDPYISEETARQFAKRSGNGRP